MKSRKNSPQEPADASRADDLWSPEERAAMQEYVEEKKRARRRAANGDAGDGEADLLTKIAEMTGRDRQIAERIHAIIKETAPSLSSRTWYGMPAYARDGHVVLFFQPAQKFKARYATLGFTDKAALDEGEMWPTTFAVAELTASAEAQIAALVKKAIGAAP